MWVSPTGIRTQVERDLSHCNELKAVYPDQLDYEGQVLLNGITHKTDELVLLQEGSHHQIQTSGSFLARL